MHTSSFLRSATAVDGQNRQCSFRGRERRRSVRVAYGKVGVLASMVFRNFTTFSRSDALVRVSTPLVPALRWTTFRRTSSSVCAEPLWKYGAPAKTEIR